ncbi:MAG: O-antigen ligase family protein [Actinomycetota bacterium]
MNALAAARPDGAAARISTAAEATILPVATGLLFYAAVGQGGFYRAQGSILAAGLTALALATIDRAANMAPLFAGMAALAAGALASGAARGWGPNSPQIVASLVAAAAVVPVARHLIGSVDRERFLSAIAWIGGGSALVGIAGVALHRSPWAIRASGLWRSASTMTYANAAGCLFVLTLGAALLLLGGRSTPSRRTAAFLCMTGLATTLSRGALVGCVVAVAVLAALRAAAMLRTLLRPAGGAAVAFAGLLPSIAGTRPQPLLALAGLVAGCAIAVTPGRARNQARTVAVALTGIGLLAALAASGVLGRVVERRATLGSETRLRTWGNTLELALRQPVLGHGPGTFSLVEEDPRQGPVLTRYVHNEYLQAFYETGLIGVAGVAGAIGVLGAWVWRRRRREPSWAIACALCAGFAVNSAFDFVWRFPLLVALVFAWVAVAVTPPPTDEESS